MLSSLSSIVDATPHPCGMGYGPVVAHGLERHWHLFRVFRQNEVFPPPPQLKGLEEEKK